MQSQSESSSSASIWCIQWPILCNAFLVEARWFCAGHVPKTDEYLKNGIISSGVHVVLVHMFFSLGSWYNQKKRRYCG